MIDIPQAQSSNSSSIGDDDPWDDTALVDAYNHAIKEYITVHTKPSAAEGSIEANDAGKYHSSVRIEKIAEEPLQRTPAKIKKGQTKGSNQFDQEQNIQDCEANAQSGKGFCPPYKDSCLSSQNQNKGKRLNKAEKTRPPLNRSFSCDPGLTYQERYSNSSEDEDDAVDDDEHLRNTDSSMNTRNLKKRKRHDYRDVDYYGQTQYPPNFFNGQIPPPYVPPYFDLNSNPFSLPAFNFCPSPSFNSWNMNRYNIPNSQDSTPMLWAYYYYGFAMGMYESLKTFRQGE